MPRQKISLAVVRTHALGTVDRAGFDALTLAIVAERLGVRSSALYTHVDGLDGLRQLVSIAALRDLTDALRAATIGRARDDALVALGHAYRDYARANPGRYSGTLYHPPDRHPELDRAGDDLDEVFRLVVAGYGHGDETAHAARCAIHGFVTLELGRPFDDDGVADAHFDQLLGLLVASMRPAAEMVSGSPRPRR